MKRKERLRYYSLYTVIFAVLSFLVFFIFIKNFLYFIIAQYSSKMEDPSSMNQMEKMGLLSIICHLYIWEIIFGIFCIICL